MENVVKSYDKELMRMAMLKHEETFKQQVYELHRLYRIQKMLMSNNEDDQRDLIGHTDDRVGVGAAEHAERIAESNDNQSLTTEIELTLSLGPSSARRTRTVKSESGQSVSSSSTGSSQTRKTSSKKNSSSFKWESESNNPWMVQAIELKLS